MPAESALPSPGNRVLARIVRGLRSCGMDPVAEPAVLAGHSVDWTGQWQGEALLLVRPRDSGQVLAVLETAHRHGVPVQIQGGRTGLVGGSVPGPPSVLLLTTSLDSLDAIDPGERTVVVGAGVTAARLQSHARNGGLRFAVDLASRDTATIGGMAATNAGGVGVIADGMMREQVRGVRAVLADGRVIDTIGRPRKDNTGYDVTGLLIGSEGTLGVITHVEVGLRDRAPDSTVALAGVGDLAEALALTRAVQASGWQVMAAEVIDAAGVARAASYLDMANPLGTDFQWALLLSVADGGAADGLAEIADRVVAVAQDRTHRDRIWLLREQQGELHGIGRRLVKVDVAVRLADMDALVRLAQDAAQQHAVAAGFFGHVADGNLHVQLSVPPDEADGPRRLSAAADAVMAGVGSMGGSISAEHGIGRRKVEALQRIRAPEQLAWLRQIKQSVDPGHLLNPGVLLSRDER